MRRALPPSSSEDRSLPDPFAPNLDASTEAGPISNGPARPSDRDEPGRDQAASRTAKPESSTSDLGGIHLSNATSYAASAFCWNPDGDSEIPLQLSPGADSLSVAHLFGEASIRTTDDQPDASGPVSSLNFDDPAWTDDPPLDRTQGYSRIRPDSLAAAAPTEPAFPESGQVISDFCLIRELGRGAFARVFLAEQLSLNRRYVAIKISQALGREPRMLARLQHTHIMPIYSALDDPETRLRIMCMPYFGGADLARLLESTGAHVRPGMTSRLTGRSLVHALDRVGNPSLEAMHRTHAGSNRRAKDRQASHNTASSQPIPSSDSARPGGSNVSASTAETAERPLFQSVWNWIRSRRAASRLAYPTADLDGPPFDSPSTSAPPRAIARGPAWMCDNPETPSEVELPTEATQTDVDAELQPARRFLLQNNFIRSGMWIGARLAEALEHAHNRGLLHRDLKPSNVLIAADGTPMLLDFNLAAETDPQDGDGERAMLGGTLPYMAPEHLEAFDQSNSIGPEVVDERSDIYSLGLIIFEMISGVLPFCEPPESQDLSVTLHEMWIERSREAPSLRQFCPQASRGLEAILAKALDPNPERRYSRARELAEDLEHQLHDRPLRHVPEPSLRERVLKWTRRHPGLSSSTSIAMLAIIMVIGLILSIVTLRDAMADREAQLAFSQLQQRMPRLQYALNTVSGGDRSTLKAGIASAQKIFQSYHLDDDPNWDRLPRVRNLQPDQQVELREQLAELILIWTRARLFLLRDRQVHPSTYQRVHWEAIAWLDQAERIDPTPSYVLYLQRSEYDQRLGLSAKADADRRTAQVTPIASAQDHYLVGTFFQARGDTERAEIHLTASFQKDPNLFWNAFMLGYLRLEQSRPLDAVGYFRTCRALMPKDPWPCHNLGVALAQAGRLEEARLALEQAIGLAEDHAHVVPQSRLALATLLLEGPGRDEARRALEILQDLRRDEAITERDRLDVQILLCQAVRKIHGPEAAEPFFEKLMRHGSQDPRVWIARASNRIERDPQAARNDLEHALGLDHDAHEALIGLAQLDLHDGRFVEVLRRTESLPTSSPYYFDSLQLRALARAHQGDPVARLDVKVILHIPTPQRLQNAACALTILGQTTDDPRCFEDALAVLDQFVKRGYPVEPILRDAELRALRDRPDFWTTLGINDPNATSRPGSQPQVQ